MLVAIPVALLLRDRPESIGISRFGEEATTATAPSDAPRHGTNPLRNTFAVLGRASHKRDFWLVAGTFFICGATTNGFIGTHFMAICGDVGIPQVHAAGLVAMIGVFSMIGSTGAGWLSDRVASRYLLFTFYALRGLSLFLLPLAISGPNTTYILPAFIVFYGLDWLATGAPNVRALSEALGKEDTPIAFGWISVAHQDRRRFERPPRRCHPHQYRELLLDVRPVRLAVHPRGPRLAGDWHALAGHSPAGGAGYISVRSVKSSGKKPFSRRVAK